jgi:hypothetical protein
LPDKQLLICPTGKDHTETGYEYLGAGGTVNDPPNKILLRSKFTMPDHKRVIVHFDESTKLERE